MPAAKLARGRRSNKASNAVGALEGGSVEGWKRAGVTIPCGAIAEHSRASTLRPFNASTFSEYSFIGASRLVKSISRRAIRREDKFNVRDAVDKILQTGLGIAIERCSGDDEQPARIPGGAPHQPIIKGDS